MKAGKEEKDGKGESREEKRWDQLRTGLAKSPGQQHTFCISTPMPFFGLRLSYQHGNFQVLFDLLTRERAIALS